MALDHISADTLARWDREDAEAEAFWSAAEARQREAQTAKLRAWGSTPAR